MTSSPSSARISPNVPALYSGDPFWLVREGFGRPLSPLTNNERCDVAIIGAGLTGALIADRVTEHGLDVVVVDARQPGVGSTATSTAILVPELDVELWELERRLGTSAATTAYRLSHRGLSALREVIESLGGEAEYRPRRSIYLASKVWHVPGLTLEGQARETHHFPSETWTREQLREEASLNGWGALVSDHAAEANPVRLTRLLLGRAIDRGARVYANTVIEAVTGGSLLTLRSRTDKRVTAGLVILATGYELACDLSFPTIRLQTTFALATAPSPAVEALEPFVLWETARPYLYLRTTADHRLIVGGADVPVAGEEPQYQLLASKTTELERRLDRLLTFKRPPTDYAWAATFAETTDGLPLVGPVPDRPNVFVAMAYGGNGITFAALAAEQIVAAIRGQPEAFPALFSPLRSP